MIGEGVVSSKVNECGASGRAYVLAGRRSVAAVEGEKV